MIEVSGLRKSFAAATALKNISFRAENGRITGLLGANGAGKTTCLRILAGVLKPDAGTVQTGESEEYGALLDHAGLYGRLTLRENIEYFAALRGMAPQETNARTASLLAQFNLSELAERRAATLSLGQSTKTALARAIVHAPRNLLLDEPTNGLDIASVRALRALLREMRHAGSCIVFSSHVLEEVTALCDSLVILSQGTVVATGTADEIVRQSAAASLEDAFMLLTGEEEVAHA